jgi:hypothetical protein
MPPTAGAENLGEVRYWKSALISGTHPSTPSARRQSRLVRRGGRDDAHARSGGVMPLPNWWFCKREYADWLGVLPSVLPTATGLPLQAIVYRRHCPGTRDRSTAARLGTRSNRREQ